MNQRRSIRNVAPEAIMLAGAGRAILLQLANPAIGYGVAHHSSFAVDPLKRLHGTLGYIYALTNGTSQQKASVTAQVHKAHRSVRSPRGTAPPGLRCSARHATVVDRRNTVRFGHAGL